MDWARRRQLSYALGVLLFIAVVLVYVYGAFIYAPPSCSDGALNQDEQGIDCGGTCARLCVAPEPEVLWARATKVTGGVYHAVAKVQNTLLDARGVGVPYQFSLYDVENLLVATRRGVLTLEAGESRTLFESAVTTGKRAPQRAFLEILPGGVWERSTSTPEYPVVIAGQESYSTTTRSLEVRVRNTSTREQTDVLVTVVLFDAQDIVISASQSKVPSVMPRATVTVPFTWPEPLERAVERVDVQVRGS